MLNKYENMTYSDNNTEFMYDDTFICRDIFNFLTKAGKLCFFSHTSPSPSNKKLYYSNLNRTCKIILLTAVLTYFTYPNYRNKFFIKKCIHYTSTQGYCKTRHHNSSFISPLSSFITFQYLNNLRNK